MNFLPLLGPINTDPKNPWVIPEASTGVWGIPKIPEWKSKLYNVKLLC